MYSKSVEEFEDLVNKLKSGLNQEKIKNNSLSRKVNEFEKLLEMRNLNSGMEFSPEMITIVREIKNQASLLEEFRKKILVKQNNQQRVFKTIFY